MGITTATAGWLAGTRQSIAEGAIAGCLAAFMPASILLAGAIVFSGGLQQIPLLGPLIAADLLFVAWLVKAVAFGLRTARTRHLYLVALPLMTFVGWAFFATDLNGVSVTPLLRVALYAVVMIVLALVGTNPRVIYTAVTGFAIWNIVGGVLDGQTRLIGVYIGDPAQMGALILAASIPILIGDLRFPGWWLTLPILVYGIWLTQTRSAWFATVIVLTVWILRRNLGRFRTVLIFLGVTIVGFKFVGAVTARLGLNADSATYRVDSIMNGIKSGLAHPWTGSGWAHVESVSVGGVVPYNLFVNVFAAVGIPALVALCLFLWALTGRLVRAKRTPFYFVVAMMAMSVTEMTLYAGSLLTVLFFVYAGIGLHDSQLLEAGASGNRSGERAEEGLAAEAVSH